MFMMGRVLAIGKCGRGRSCDCNGAEESGKLEQGGSLGQGLGSNAGVDRWFIVKYVGA